MSVKLRMIFAKLGSPFALKSLSKISNSIQLFGVLKLTPMRPAPMIVLGGFMDLKNL